MKSTRVRDPRGVARSDYSTPCPGCRQRILTGQGVTKVMLPGQRAQWWHAECRRAVVAGLVADS